MRNKRKKKNKYREKSSKNVFVSTTYNYKTAETKTPVKNAGDACSLQTESSNTELNRTDECGDAFQDEENDKSVSNDEVVNGDESINGLKSVFDDLRSEIGGLLKCLIPHDEDFCNVHHSCMGAGNKNSDAEASNDAEGTAIKDDLASGGGAEEPNLDVNQRAAVKAVVETYLSSKCLPIKSELEIQLAKKDAEIAKLNCLIQDNMVKLAMLNERLYELESPDCGYDEAVSPNLDIL